VYPAWPCSLISIHSPANLTQLMFNTIAWYSGGWTQGNALPIFHPAAVRVGYPSSLVMRGWQQRLAGCLNPNLYCAQGGGGVETAGATMAVNEMLMQSNEWAVNLFPVWPHNSRVAFFDMRARGNILVSAEFNATLQTITRVQLFIQPNKQNTNSYRRQVRLMHPWQFTQIQKEDRAMAKLKGERDSPSQTAKPAGQVNDIYVYQSDFSPLQRSPVNIKRYERAPLPVTAAMNAVDSVGELEYRMGAEYETNEELIWFEWDACDGCTYEIMQNQDRETEQVRPF